MKKYIVISSIILAVSLGSITLISSCSFAEGGEQDGNSIVG
jgi:hypothetical protein